MSHGTFENVLYLIVLMTKGSFLYALDVAISWWMDAAKDAMLELQKYPPLRLNGEMAAVSVILGLVLTLVFLSTKTSKDSSGTHPSNAERIQAKLRSDCPNCQWKSSAEDGQSSNDEKNPTRASGNQSLDATILPDHSSGLTTGRTSQSTQTNLLRRVPEEVSQIVARRNSEKSHENFWLLRKTRSGRIYGRYRFL